LQECRTIWISLLVRTTTSNLIAVRRLLLAPDDPESSGPAPEQRYRLHRKAARTSMSVASPRATGPGQIGPRVPAGAHDC
jgi:hypothetical protein